MIGFVNLRMEVFFVFFWRYLCHVASGRTPYGGILFSYVLEIRDLRWRFGALHGVKLTHIYLTAVVGVKFVTEAAASGVANRRIVSEGSRYNGVLKASRFGNS